MAHQNDTAIRLADNDAEKLMILQSLGNFSKEGDPVEDEESAPEDSIPDLPENQKARDFLKNAPSKGLFMPLGSQVKVMQCWRCKAYGHRTGDAECPMGKSGNFLLDSQRQAREDPMSRFVAKKMLLKKEKYDRVELLKELVAEIREEEESRRQKKKSKNEKEESEKEDRKRSSKGKEKKKDNLKGDRKKDKKRDK